MRNKVNQKRFYGYNVINNSQQTKLLITGTFISQILIGGISAKNLSEILKKRRSHGGLRQY